MDTGLIHIYSGDGKGKTTCSVGLCVRMVGNGGKVAFIQFMKGKDTGEIDILKKLGVDIMRTPSIMKFYSQMNDEEKKSCNNDNQKCLDYANKISKEDYDLIVLDEIISAINLSCISLEDVVDLLKNKNKKTEIVLTGRNPKDELVEIADYYSYIKNEKHPYMKGIMARKGVEF